MNKNNTNNKTTKSIEWNQLNMVEFRTYIKKEGTFPKDTPDTVKEDFYMMLWLTKVNFKLFSQISHKLQTSMFFCKELSRVLTKKELVALISQNPSCKHVLLASAKKYPDIIKHSNDPKIWENKAFMRSYVRSGGIDLWKLPDYLRKNGSYMLFLISLDGSTFRFADITLKESLSFCEKAKSVCQKFTPITENEFFDGNLLTITYTKIEELFDTRVIRELKLEC